MNIVRRGKEPVRTWCEEKAKQGMETIKAKAMQRQGKGMEKVRNM